MPTGGKDLLRQAKLLGFEFVRVRSGGHVELHNAEVNKSFTTSATPSDWRSYRNALSQMERLSGRKLPKSRSGHFSHKRVSQSDFRRSDLEQQRCDEADELLSEADTLRDEFACLAGEPISRSAAQRCRQIVRRYSEIEKRLSAVYRTIPPIA